MRLEEDPPAGWRAGSRAGTPEQGRINELFGGREREVIGARRGEQAQPNRSVPRREPGRVSASTKAKPWLWLWPLPRAHSQRQALRRPTRSLRDTARVE